VFGAKGARNEFCVEVGEGAPIALVVQDLVSLLFRCAEAAGAAEGPRAEADGAIAVGRSVAEVDFDEVLLFGACVPDAVGCSYHVKVRELGVAHGGYVSFEN